jgi:hypothetical protein
MLNGPNNAMQQLCPRHLASRQLHPNYLSEGFERLTFCGRKPRTRKYIRSSFYAQDFTSNISVCIVSGHRHGTKHRHSYTKPGDTKHDYKHKSGHNQHAARNDLNPDGNDFHHPIGLDGDTANFPARKHDQRKSFSYSGNAGRCRQRRIGNRRNSRHYADADRNFNHRGPMHAF